MFVWQVILMEALFFVVLGWGILTLLGHGTWVLIRGIFRVLASVSPQTTASTQTTASPQTTASHRTATGTPRNNSPSSAPDPQRDLKAFSRMVDALTSTEELSSDQAERLKEKAGSFVQQIGSGTQPTSQPKPRSAAQTPTARGAPASQALLQNAGTMEAPPIWNPEASPLITTEVSHRRGLADVMAGFLEQHNIRWGELIAGMLIVLCSIGLVLSLWSTLTAAHRIVPAVVFMSADAAIFAAGLYTMRRWKLRHTSRAVLIIATLLVPLCVLAGLAAAGANANATSVSLTDPVTLGVMGIATIGCGWLLWQASLALVGWGGALALTSSVVASSLSLAMLPVAGRWLGAHAGWMVLIPSLITAIALVAQRKSKLGQSKNGRSRNLKPLKGRRSWKNHWLHLGIAVGSLASVVVYAAFFFREADDSVWLQIAIATVPTWVAIAMVEATHCFDVKQNASWTGGHRATKHLIASVLVFIALGAIAAILPAAIGSLPWLWTHAIAVSMSAVLFSVLRRRFDQVLLAIIPITLVAMATSPVWMSGQIWDDVVLHRTVLSGEPMLVAVAMLIVGVVLKSVFGRQDTSTRLWNDLWGMISVAVFGLGTLWRSAGIIAGPIERALSDSANPDVSGIPLSFLAVPAMSTWTLALHLAGLIGLVLIGYRARRDESTETGDRIWIGLVSIGMLFIAVVAATRLTESADERLIAMVSLAAGGLAGLHWWMRLRSLVIGAAGLVGGGSLVLLGTSWLPAVMDHVSPDRSVVASLAAWWIVSAIGLMRSTTKWQPILSTVLFALTAAMVTPAIRWTSPIVWFQASALGSLAWIVIGEFSGRWSAGHSPRPAGGLTTFQSYGAFDLAVAWVRIVGVVSAVMVLVGIGTQASWTIWWSLPLGGLMTLAALVTFAVGSQRDWRWPLPFLLPIMGGHLACFAAMFGWISRDEVMTVVLVCGWIGSLGSAVSIWWRHSIAHSWHVVGQTCVLIGSVFWVSTPTRLLSLASGRWWASNALTLLAVSGLVIAAVALMRFTSRILSRGLGWLVMFAGAYLIGIELIGHRFHSTSLTWMMAWLGGCIVLWRSDRLRVNRSTTDDPVATDRPATWGSRADTEATALMLPMLGLTSLSVLIESSGRWVSAWDNTVTQGVLQCGIAALAGASAWMCRDAASGSADDGESRSRWLYCVWLIVGSIATGCTLAAAAGGAEWGTRWIVLSLSASSALVAGVWCLPRRGHSAIESAIERVTIGCTFLGTFIALAFSVGHERIGELAPSVDGSSMLAIWTRLSVLGIGVLAWGMFSLSEQTQPADGPSASRRRHLCVGIGLWAIALIAVLGSGSLLRDESIAQALPFLVATMRLLIASVVTIGLLLLAIPKLLEGPFVDRWQSALRRGGKIAGATAVGSLVVMLVFEWTLRQRDLGIEGLPMPVVVVVTLILGSFALMAGGLAVLSGPALGNDRKPNWLLLGDRERTGLLYVAQVVAGLTWLHFYLCRGSSAYLGLRQIWPYVVMGIAFASVGMAQWALRRKDTVLFDTMKRTAMFLPLIPVIGFWLSGAYAMMLNELDWSWTFYRGTTSYQGLLIVGAIYYGIMSLLWKNGFPRVATVVLANAGLWVMLTQTPGWGFLSHPQAWLIPPAACVLLIAHLQRDSLEPQIGSAIRYAATLMIYLSSTADILLSEIGTSLWGPMILVGLSLAGMAAGVALRVKPFLYLGTIFTFLGIMSMVWHAGQAIDAVWPWWVFGITTGLILLSVLAGIEKHQDQLRKWTDQLAAWK